MSESEVICQNCNDSFNPNSSHQKWCDDCRTCKCQRCGRSFLVGPADIKRGYGKYCSNDCRWPKRKVVQLGDGTSEIQLSRGKVALVDTEIINRLKVHRWAAWYSGNRWYAKTRIDGSEILMHRFILNVPEGKQVDHINGDGLDNRRCNLRICVPSQNMMNQTNFRGGTSKFKGVSWYKAGEKWRAYINKDGRQISLGYFEDEKQAARAYDEAAAELFGEFAYLNVDKFGVLDG